MVHPKKGGALHATMHHLCETILRLHWLVALHMEVSPPATLMVSATPDGIWHSLWPTSMCYLHNKFGATYPSKLAQAWAVERWIS